MTVAQTMSESVAHRRAAVPMHMKRRPLWTRSLVDFAKGLVIGAIVVLLVWLS